MNKIIKILLSAVMVSLSALAVPLEEDAKNIKTEYVTVQSTVVKPARNQNAIEISINFEIDETEAMEEMNHKMAEIEFIEDKKEWFIAYKNIIDEYSYIVDPPETIYDYFTEEELELLFHVVQAEIGDEYYSFEQKVNVSSVIFNRLDHERFPDTLLEILTPDQFSTILNGRYKNVEISDDTILACEYAFQIEDTVNGCVFFDSNNTLDYQFVFSDKAHNFYSLRGEN